MHTLPPRTDCSFTEYVAKHHVEVASQVEDPAKGPSDQKTMDNLDTFSDEQGLFRGNGQYLTLWAQFKETPIAPKGLRAKFRTFY